MHKLVILIHPVEEWQAFEDGWPEFLHQVEAMPGLIREASSRVEDFIYGDIPIIQVHELFFESLSAARDAMASSQGRAAGRLLQGMTGGRMTLFIADHKEDEITNIQKYRSGDAGS